MLEKMNRLALTLLLYSGTSGIFIVEPEGCVNPLPGVCGENEDIETAERFAQCLDLLKGTKCEKLYASSAFKSDWSACGNKEPDPPADATTSSTLPSTTSTLSPEGGGGTSRSSSGEAPSGTVVLPAYPRASSITIVAGSASGYGKSCEGAIFALSNTETTDAAKTCTQTEFETTSRLEEQFPTGACTVTDLVYPPEGRVLALIKNGKQCSKSGSAILMLIVEGNVNAALPTILASLISAALYIFFV